MSAERMSSEVHVVVSCSSRKRRPVPARLRLRNVRPRGASAAGKWIERLSGASEAELPAHDLYAGEHWSVVTRVAASTGQAKVRLWVASAGYGLIPYASPVKPYSATFDRSHEDVVPIAGDRWWHQLAAWSGPVPGEPRTVAELAEAHPRGAVLLVLSATYLAACARDAARAADVLRKRGQFAVISCGSGHGGLAEHTLPGDARLQALFGGSRQSLNARVAEHVLAGSGNGFSVREAHRGLASLLANQPAIPTYDRERLDDKEVRRFIHDRLGDRRIAWTPLLTELRAMGYACEQSRFRELYAEVSSS